VQVIDWKDWSPKLPFNLLICWWGH